MSSCFLSESNTLRVRLVRTFIRPCQISSSLPACAQTLAKGQEAWSQALLVMQDSSLFCFFFNTILFCFQRVAKLVYRWRLGEIRYCGLIFAHGGSLCVHLHSLTHLNPLMRSVFTSLSRNAFPNECVCVSWGAALICADDISSLAPLRETNGSTTGLEGPFFHHTHSYKVLPAFIFPLGSGGKQKLEVYCVLFPGAKRRKRMKRKDLRERREEYSKSCKVDCVSKCVHRCNCILSLAYVASQTLKCNICHRRGRSTFIYQCGSGSQVHTHTRAHTLSRAILFIVHSKQERLPAAHFRKNKQLKQSDTRELQQNKSHDRRSQQLRRPRNINAA